MNFQPIVLVMVGLWAVGLYSTYRGFARDEFLARGKIGWHHFQKWSFSWWLGTTVNLLFVGGFTYGIILSLFVRPLAP